MRTNTVQVRGLGVRSYLSDRFLGILTEPFQKPPDNLGLPRTLLRKHSETVQTIALMVALLALFVTLPSTTPSTKPFAWSCAAIILAVGIAYWKLPNPLGPHARLLLISAVTAFGLVAVHVVLWLVYGYPANDPHSLWIALLVPLIIISKDDRSLAWLLITLLVTIPYLCFRLYISYVADDADRSIFTSPEMIGAYGQVAFIVGVSAVVHAIVRGMHYYQYVIRLEKELLGILKTEPGFHAAYQTAVRKLRREYFPDSQYAFILFWNEDAQRLKIVASDGLDDSEWSEIELAETQGITGRAFNENKTIRIGNVGAGNTSFYGPGTLAGVRSELATPIRVGEQPIGVLDIESTKINAHSRFHGAYLEAWANAIAGAYQHFQALDARAAATQKLFDEIGALTNDDALSAARNSRDPLHTWFRKVANPLATYFGADYLAVVRLAVGTGMPFLPPLIWPRSQLRNLQRAFRRFESLPESSALWHLLKATGIRDWSTIEQWREWERPADRWLRDELRKTGIATLVLIPVGTPGDPVAMLFLGYRQPKMLSDLDRLMMTAFSGVIERSLRQVYPWPSDLHRVRVSVHREIVPHCQHLIQQTNTLREKFIQLGLPEENDEIGSLLTDHVHRIKLMRQLTKYATHRERFDLRYMTLDEALKHVASDFEEARQQERRITISVAPEIEDQLHDVRGFLFWVAAEAIANAIEHGKATLVSAKLRVRPQQILLEVTDNGEGLPESPDMTQPDGIFHLRRVAREIFNASLSLNGAQPSGVVVSLKLPIRGY